MTTQTTRILNREFVLAFFAQFIVSFVFCILIPTLPIYLSKIGSTEMEIGVLIGILGLSSLVLRPLVGRFLLKTSEIVFMIAGAVLLALTSAGYLFVLPFWPFLVIRALQGVGAAFFWTATVTLVANVSPRAHLGQSLSYYFMAYNVAFAVAPSLGMFLINSFDFKLLFIFCTLLSLLSLFIITRLNKRGVHPSEKLVAEDAPFLSRSALSPSVVAFMASLSWGALTTFFPLYAIQHGMANPGLFFGTFAVMVILGRAFGGRVFDLRSRETVILPCLITYIIAMSMLFSFKSLTLFILAAGIWGIGHGFLYPTLAAYTLDVVPSSPGLAMGTYLAFDDLGVGLGPIIMGIVLRLSGYPAMFLFLGFISFINLSYFYFLMRRRSIRRSMKPIAVE